jgi:hypothetical protein
LHLTAGLARFLQGAVAEAALVVHALAPRPETLLRQAAGEVGAAVHALQHAEQFDLPGLTPAQSRLRVRLLVGSAVHRGFRQVRYVAGAEAAMSVATGHQVLKLRTEAARHPQVAILCLASFEELTPGQLDSLYQRHRYLLFRGDCVPAPS